MASAASRLNLCITLTRFFMNFPVLIRILSQGVSLATNPVGLWKKLDKKSQATRYGGDET